MLAQLEKEQGAGAGHEVSWPSRPPTLRAGAREVRRFLTRSDPCERRPPIVAGGGTARRVAPNNRLGFARWLVRAGPPVDGAVCR